MINPTRVTFGEIVYPPGGVLGPRIQRTYQLVFVHHGSMTAWVDGSPLHAGSGTATLLFPGHEERFEFATTCATHHTWVHMALPGLPHALQTRLEQLPVVIALSPAMHELMHQVLQLRNSSLPTAEEIIQTIAAQMLWRYVGEAEQGLLAKRQRHPEGARLPHSALCVAHRPSIVEQAQHFIAGRLDQPLTLALIAQSVSISPAHLIRLFRVQVGETPLHYVWQQRVKLGIELLEQTGLTVEQIAICCGFRTSYHFTRRVKWAVGLTPTQVRRQAWQRQR